MRAELSREESIEAMAMIGGIGIHGGALWGYHNTSRRKIALVLKLDSRLGDNRAMRGVMSWGFWLSAVSC